MRNSPILGLFRMTKWRQPSSGTTQWSNLPESDDRGCCLGRRHGSCDDVLVDLDHALRALDLRSDAVFDHQPGLVHRSSAGVTMSISVIAAEKSRELLVMNRSAPTATAVARCTASAARSR